MVYASSRAGAVQVAQDKGVEVTKRIEIGDPDEIGAARLKEEAAVPGAEEAGSGVDSRPAFSRPKRPGKR
jgi:twinfilin